MMNLKIIIILFFLTYSFCVSTEIKWNKVFYNDSLRFIAIDNSDSLYCMALAAGRTYKKVVLKSTDAGLTWYYVLMDSLVFKNGKWPKDPQDIAYPTRDFCIVSLDSNSFLRTKDGGITWEEIKIDLPSYVPFGFFEVHLLDENNGLLAARQHLAISHDGFDTWKIVPIPCKDIILCSEMPASHSICVIGFDKKFYRSDDDGNTWNKYEHPDYTMPMRLQFIDSLIGYEVGGKRSGVGDIEYNLVYKTIDGGTTWFNSLDTVHGTSGLQKLDFYDKDNGIVVGQFGYIYWTSNGGNSWYFDSNDVFLNEIPPTINVCYIKKERAIIVDFLGRIFISSETTDVEDNPVYNDDYILFQDATTDLLTIRFKNDIPYNTELQIFNSYGQKIPGLSHASEPGTNRIEIDVSSLSSGVYFAELSGSGKVRTIPFIVMR
ncbi:MAG: hypothetical protein A2X61_05735 [Ignavibacteria bacterium GWB2_35_12]|nr:MAG: hypothetical protein A2X63_07110 [Ignavibacteria bacterium GWA2_35_8]OGU42254.1 MAG: hypothetical protein A2X61_05735 [Ignavibacteria bacterium GWB2_35_12]OGU93519.1 MAG: hypothetical protein A2220_13005 [Ignavibacteria bacterium RIFOXYA2_FULL_35_10]OGV20051.1 MAG: hypothetical protein A2475_04520 [Ignavibacteria bacterium RIFOXYC2_FULL_35_21]